MDPVVCDSRRVIVTDDLDPTGLFRSEPVKDLLAAIFDIRIHPARHCEEIERDKIDHITFGMNT